MASAGSEDAGGATPCPGGTPRKTVTNARIRLQDTHTHTRAVTTCHLAFLALLAPAAQFPPFPNNCGGGAEHETHGDWSWDWSWAGLGPACIGQYHCNGPWDRQPQLPFRERFASPPPGLALVGEDPGGYRIQSRVVLRICSRYYAVSDKALGVQCLYPYGLLLCTWYVRVASSDLPNIYRAGRPRTITALPSHPDHPQIHPPPPPS